MKKIMIFIFILPILWSDPCGMVPPIYTGEGPAITRIGLQKTYVFYKDGVETIVIRPGFSGKVDQFGMLIPFPKPPALRKVADDVFKHIDHAIDPPEIPVYLYDEIMDEASADDGGAWGETEDEPLEYNTVKVLKQEAVGMYEVAVLAAGSAQALNRWMDNHGYQYPKGMDNACSDYIKMRWCFVAVKTRVGQKQGVAPRAGMRSVDSKLPKGANFDGHVQGMGFRFFIDKPVVPMRLSTFNEGSLRNIVYILTDKPCRINSIPERYVVRQISGNELYQNLTQPLPLRVYGGQPYEIDKYTWEFVQSQRNPSKHNSIAKELFASDLLAARNRKLSHNAEETEKMLLRIGESLHLRGSHIDALNANVTQEAMQVIVKQALEDLRSMTLTVVDGDFPREVLANENLTFSSYEMPHARNRRMHYHAVHHGMYMEPGGVLYKGSERPVKNSGIVLSWWALMALMLAFLGYKGCGGK